VETLYIPLIEDLVLPEDLSVETPACYGVAPACVKCCEWLSGLVPMWQNMTTGQLICRDCFIKLQPCDQEKYVCI